MLWTLGWTPSAWNVVPGETASSKIALSALTHDRFLCAFRTEFFFFVETAQNYIAADMGSVLAQVPPQMHRPSLSLLSCSSKGLVGLQGKTVRVATFLRPKT